MIGFNKVVYSDTEGNAIRLSKVQKLEGEIAFRGVAIKAVFSGLETYHLSGKNFQVCTETYLIGNTYHRADISIQGPDVTSGICIDCSPALLLEVGKGMGLSEESIEQRLLSYDFVVNTQPFAHSHLGMLLQSLPFRFRQISPESRLSEEWMADIAQAVIQDQTWVQKSAESLRLKRRATLDAVFPQLLQARSCLMDHIENPQHIDLKKLAQQAGLSPFHFLRLFKQAFGVPPMQFFLECRLEAAYASLKSGKKAIDVGHTYGFTDGASFHKAFKKKFGFTPGEAAKQKSNF